jgi:hypothetical protein
MIKKGDLVKLKEGEEPRNKRDVGTALKFDVYCSPSGIERMVEVLWNTGKVGWILTNRVEVIT